MRRLYVLYFGVMTERPSVPSGFVYRMSMTNRRSPRRFTVRTAMADYLSATTRASAGRAIAEARRAHESERKSTNRVRKVLETRPNVG
jgi:hypothetical protein